jgi:hypothetical protein
LGVLYGLSLLKPELAFKDVEGFILIAMDVKWWPEAGGKEMFSDRDAVCVRGLGKVDGDVAVHEPEAVGLAVFGQESLRQCRSP